MLPPPHRLSPPCTTNSASTRSRLRGRDITHLMLSKEPIELGPAGRRDVCTRQGMGKGGGEKAEFRTAVEGRAGEFAAIERLPLREVDHRSGELDFPACSLLAGGQESENLRLQDIS